MRGYCYIPEAPPGEFTASIDDDPVIGQRCGDYLLVGLLGAGGFGRVYRALQLPVGMPAAVKLLDIESATAGMAAIKLAKFEIEAQALARLSHPNIIRLFQYGQHRGAPFLAMELIENARNLWTEIELRVAESRPFLLDEVQAILMQVLAALEAAHANQIVHRDIKPENIMLQSFAGHGLFVKVLDFGLAKFTEDRSATSLLLGTPAYMAYEQLMRGPLGPWTDLYALGVLSFELMTGKRPYGGAGVQETLALKLDTAFDPWSRVDGLGFPEELRIFAAHALARESEARYGNATEFRVGLERALNALRDAGEQFTKVPAERLVEATEIPFVPQPEGAPLPDPTRRIARPGKSDGATLEAAKTEASDPAAALAGQALPTLLPKPVATAPTGAIPSAREILGASAARPAKARPKALWAALGLMLVMGIGIGAWLGTRGKATPAARPEVETPLPAVPAQEAVIGPPTSRIPTTAETKMQTVRVDEGTFARGSAPHDPAHQDDEDLHEVVLEHPLFAATTEVTQAQWAAQFGTRPWHHQACGPMCPVESVTWWDAVAYANAMSEREGRQKCYALRGCRGVPGDGEYNCGDARFVGLDCTGWRLPTEAEWEYLARAASPPGELAQVAVLQTDSPKPVASKTPNAFGLSDMFGNVREWVHDAYGAYPPKNKMRDPLGPGGDGDRVIRGGGYRSDLSMVRAAARDHASLSNKEADLGFRLVRTAR